MYINTSIKVLSLVSIATTDKEAPQQLDTNRSYYNLPPLSLSLSLSLPLNLSTTYKSHIHDNRLPRQHRGNARIHIHRDLPYYSIKTTSTDYTVTYLCTRVDRL